MNKYNERVFHMVCFAVLLLAIAVIFISGMVLMETINAYIDSDIPVKADTITKNI